MSTTPKGFRVDPRRTSASTGRLLQIKDVTQEDADKIRLLWVARDFGSLRLAYPECGIFSEGPTVFRHVQRECVDRILRTSGVEFLGYSVGRGVSVYYCNAGDTYATTVLFLGHHMRVGCIGDLIENNRITQPVQL